METEEIIENLASLEDKLNYLSEEASQNRGNQEILEEIHQESENLAKPIYDKYESHILGALMHRESDIIDLNNKINYHLTKIEKAYQRPQIVDLLCEFEELNEGDDNTLEGYLE